MAQRSAVAAARLMAQRSAVAAARPMARERRYSALVAGVKTRAQRTTVPRSPS